MKKNTKNFIARVMAAVLSVGLVLMTNVTVFAEEIEIPLSGYYGWSVNMSTANASGNPECYITEEADGNHFMRLNYSAGGSSEHYIQVTRMLSEPIAAGESLRLTFRVYPNKNGIDSTISWHNIRNVPGIQPKHQRWVSSEEEVNLDGHWVVDAGNGDSYDFFRYTIAGPADRVSFYCLGEHTDIALDNFSIQKTSNGMELIDNGGFEEDMYTNEYLAAEHGWTVSTEIVEPRELCVVKGDGNRMLYVRYPGYNGWGGAMLMKKKLETPIEADEKVEITFTAIGELTGGDVEGGFDRGNVWIGSSQMNFVWTGTEPGSGDASVWMMPNAKVGFKRILTGPLTDVEFRIGGPAGGVFFDSFSAKKIDGDGTELLKNGDFDHPTLTPKITGLKMKGNFRAGETITGEYIFGGLEEGNSDFGFEISTTPDGGYQPVAGQTKTYVPTSADIGKYIRFYLVPQDASGKSWPRVSSAFSRIGAPGALIVKNAAFTDASGVPLTSLQASASLYAKTEIENVSDKAEDYLLLIYVYDKNGNMTANRLVRGSVPAKTTINVADAYLDRPAYTPRSYAKFFLWDSLGGMNILLCEPILLR